MKDIFVLYNKYEPAVIAVTFSVVNVQAQVKMLRFQMLIFRADCLYSEDWPSTIFQCHDLFLCQIKLN